MMELGMYSGERSLMHPLLIPKVRSPSGLMKHIALPMDESQGWRWFKSTFEEVDEMYLNE